VRGVFKVLTEIAMASGKDVQARKKDTPNPNPNPNLDPHRNPDQARLETRIPHPNPNPSHAPTQTRKKDKVKQMLVSAQEKEAQYIVRALQGKMRIGASEQTVLVTLSNPSPTPYPLPPTPYPLPPTPYPLPPTP
jgi:hypothetical protein